MLHLVAACILLIVAMATSSWANGYAGATLIANPQLSLFDALLPISIFIAAVALPLGILISRDNVRARRREIILSLEKFFRHAAKPNDPLAPEIWSIIPSFEFVKSKYFGDGEKNESRDFSIRFFLYRYLYS